MTNAQLRKFIFNLTHNIYTDNDSHDDNNDDNWFNEPRQYQYQQTQKAQLSLSNRASAMHFIGARLLSTNVTKTCVTETNICYWLDQNSLFQPRII